MIAVRDPENAGGHDSGRSEPILELLDITKDTALEIKTDGEALIIRPVKLSKKERIRESTKRMMAVHDETLRKLSKRIQAVMRLAGVM